MTDQLTEGRPVGPQPPASGREASVPPKQNQTTQKKGRTLRTKFAAVRREAGPMPGASALLSKIVMIAMMVGIVCGPLALAYATFTARKPAPAPAAAETSTDTATRPVEQAAQALVRTWLSASSDDADTVAGMLVQTPSQMQLPKDRPQAPTAVEVVEVTQVDPSLWRVDVAASWPNATRARETYRVTVTQVDESAAVLALPARVATASPSKDVAGQELERLSPTSPAAVTSTGFVTALLTGAQQDLNRWIAPNSTVDAVTPAACEQVEVQEVSALDSSVPPTPGNGDTVRVGVDLTCSKFGNETAMHYWLDLTGRDARWEVNDLSDLPAAPLTPANKTTAPTPTTAATPN